MLNAVEVKATGVLADIPPLLTNKRLAYMALSDAQELLRLEDRVLEMAIGEAGAYSLKVTRAG